MNEEKKLTDEEIVKDIERSTGMPSYWKAIVLDLIHRLQDKCLTLIDQKFELQKQLDETTDALYTAQEEIEKLKAKRKKILANKIYSDTTLKTWKKEDLIEQIRILEHNWACAEESLNNSAKNAEKLLAEQKAEIERLTKEPKVTAEDFERVKQQAVKDTAKEIFSELRNLFIEHSAYGCDTNQYSGYYDYSLKMGEIIEWIDDFAKERYGVEV